MGMETAEWYNNFCLIGHTEERGFAWHYMKAMERLIGHQLFWYGHTESKLHCDVVLPPTKKNSLQYNIKDIGHRKLFNFIGAQAGFRSVLLDTLIKVG